MNNIHKSLAVDSGYREVSGRVLYSDAYDKSTAFFFVYEDTKMKGMHWFKHMRETRKDPAIRELMEEFGHYGYAIYFMILEEIAGIVDENSNVCLRMSRRSWRKTLATTEQKLDKLLAFARVLGLLSVDWTSTHISISCPKLLKYRDEYSKKKSKQKAKYPDSVRTLSAQEEE